MRNKTDYMNGYEIYYSPQVEAYSRHSVRPSI